MKPVFIYALNCPITGRTRYIGQTVNPDTRLSKHFSEIKGKNYRRANWLRSLRAKGLKPGFELLAQVPETTCAQDEINYITAFKSMGFDLVNTTVGGEGLGSGKNHPCFGKKQSPEHVAKTGVGGIGEKNHFFGKKHTPETRAKMRAAKKGYVPWNKGLKGSQVGWSKGKAVPPEVRAKISSSLRGNVPWNKGMKNGKRE